MFPFDENAPRDKKTLLVENVANKIDAARIALAELETALIDAERNGAIDIADCVRAVSVVSKRCNGSRKRFEARQNMRWDCNGLNDIG